MSVMDVNSLDCTAARALKKRTIIVMQSTVGLYAKFSIPYAKGNLLFT